MTKYERETIITFNEGDPSARLYTCSLRLIRQMDDKIVSDPEQFKLLKIYHDIDGQEYAKEYLVVSKASVQIRKNYSFNPIWLNPLNDMFSNSTPNQNGGDINV